MKLRVATAVLKKLGSSTGTIRIINFRCGRNETSCDGKGQKRNL